MIVFILCSVLLAILVQIPNGFLPLLATPVALGIGLIAMAMSLLAGYLKRLPTIAWHDGFATSGLVVWYAYWRPQFDDGAPMFFFFPLYYALLTSFITLSLINKAQYFDRESVAHLRYLEKLTRLDISVIVAFVLISLLITRHYALYPVAMTLFVIRHTMVVCLESIVSDSSIDH